MHKNVFGMMALAMTILVVAPVGAEEPHAMSHHPMTTSPGGDAREQVNFPPEMRQHTLTNMRDHLQALAEILNDLADSRYDDAAKVAHERLGMGSPSAAGCQLPATAEASPVAREGMDHRMASLMPEGMRQFGLAMHRAASEFATTATQAAQTGDATAALTGLAQVTRQCVACHAAYRFP